MSSVLHKDSRLNPSPESSNDSGNASIHELIERRLVSRRSFLASSAGMTAAAVVGGTALDALSNPAEAHGWPGDRWPPADGRIGFQGVPPNLQVGFTDAVTVPAGYSASVLAAWGDPLDMGPAWNPVNPMTEAQQLRSFGSHTDGMHYFPYPGWQGNGRGLLAVNSEYCDPALVNGIMPAGNYLTATITLPMVRAQQAAHGVTIMEVEKGRDGRWAINRRSPFNRRITGNTPCRISGPAAGHELMRTAADPSGTRVLGTLNNCAHGYTPWGTYLTCEENWNGYFSNETGDVEGVIDIDRKFEIIKGQTRYGVVKGGFGYRWHEPDARFRADLNPNEPNRFGWVVEIDPWNPNATPIKRTAMGRVKHESAMAVVGRDRQVAFYMGDDERNEYLYKFVCAKKLNFAGRSTDRDMLDQGTLYVAKFHANGTGEWLPLVHGQNGLTAANGFRDQGEVLVKTRQAADRLGATMMDRPEWIAAHPVTREVYMTLTNNSRRGNTPVSSNKPDGTTNAASANPPVDAANPRPDNDFGHIIRWREHHSDVGATTFDWDIFVNCGDKATKKTLGGSYSTADLSGVGYKGDIVGDDYGAPDGLWFDKDGRLWIQTDQVGNATGDWVNIGSNVMMCADPKTGETRRFLTSPRNCEVTGVISTPDGRTMFVGIQHPGEDWSTSFTQNSTWPDSGSNGPTRHSSAGPFKPRSGIVVITKDDGGVVGT
jgi:secreted PhoX family phosphatase